MHFEKNCPECVLQEFNSDSLISVSHLSKRLFRLNSRKAGRRSLSLFRPPTLSIKFRMANAQMDIGDDWMRIFE